MAWRIDEQVVRGELDCRERGRVTGTIWLVGRTEPIRLELTGCPWRDIAGHHVRFTHAQPQPQDLAGLAELQQGVAGDITASRKVKVPDCTMDELMVHYEARTPFPWHWGNSLYLEWFSERNGRVVIESAAYQLEIDATATWTMTPEEEVAQREANARAMADFMARLGQALDAADLRSVDAEDLDDTPQSVAEAAADAEQARMDLLLDRISARMEREGRDDGNFEQIMHEERERLRIERGEKDEELTPGQEAERAAWIEEINAIAKEAVDEAAAEAWKGEERGDRRHPLVRRCSQAGIRAYHDIKGNGWLSAAAREEHPLREIPFGLTTAGAKLAGALQGSQRDEPWPAPALFAGDTLVRLKKARGHLADTLRALDSADAENLATPAWRAHLRQETESILTEVKTLIRQVRAVLRDPGDDEPVSG